MNLENAFTVPLPVDEAWPVLLDVQRVAPCMPGATLLTLDGDEFTGTVKVKIGPVQMTYKGSARFTETDGDKHRAVIEASGKDTRGGGTAAATVTLQAEPDGAMTRVHVLTDLNITGRPAQFGRGVLAEVSGKLVDQFAGSLAKEMTTVDAPAATAVEESEAAPSTSAPSGPASSATAAPIASAEPVEAIDLLSVAGGSVVKRLAPLAGVVALLLLLVWRRRRRA